jgi:hypothetical protein
MNKGPVPPDDPELREALRAMAEADANLTTPQRVEDSLMRAWDSRAHTPSSARGRRRIAWTVLALAASLALAVALRDRWAPITDQTAPRSARETAPEGAAGAAVDVSDTMAWLDTDPASLEIVRLRVASATLAAQGYTFSDPDGDGSVEIEMIIGSDGAARSVRFNAAWPPETIY